MLTVIPLAGVAADRIDRKALMLSSQAGMLLLAFLLGPPLRRAEWRSGRSLILSVRPAGCSRRYECQPYAAQTSGY